MSEDSVDPEMRLREIVEGFDTAMLVTHAGDGFRARPMAVAESAPEGVLYFVTDIDSGKVGDLAANPGAQVILQDGKRFASLAGRVRIVRDRALVEQLWTEASRLWFPQGKDDPSLCVLAFHVHEGEYWDRGGLKALKFLFKAAKAYATGTRPTLDESEHGKASL
jgi:general stress protein 26